MIERQADCPGGTIAHPPPLSLDDTRAILAEFEPPSVEQQRRMIDVQPPEATQLDLSIFRKDHP